MGYGYSMISDKKTDYRLANPKQRSWIPDEPESAGDTGLFMLFMVLVSAMVGLILALVADAAFLGGMGMSKESEASGLQFFTTMFVPVALSLIGTPIWSMVLPRLMKPTYFTTEAHKSAHREFMRLSSTGQAHAQEAYDALAGFDVVPSYDYNSDNGGAEYTLFVAASSVWDDTLKIIQRRERSGGLELHQDRLDNARQALESLKN